MTAPDPTETKLNAVARFVGALQGKGEGVAMALLLGLGAVGIITLYRYSEQWAPLLWQSQIASMMAIVGFACVVAGLLVTSWGRRLGEQLATANDRAIQQNKDQVEALKGQISSGEASRSKLIDRLFELEKRDAVCQEQVKALHEDLRELREARRGPRRTDGLGLDSGHGALSGA